jgi:hypothetical protein
VIAFIAVTAVSGADIIGALIAVESGGISDAVGDNGKAKGVLQIHPIMVQDVNRICRLTKKSERFTLEDRLSPKESIRMCRIYLAYYGERLQGSGHAVTLEDLARMWNGGPSGPKKASTLKYWRKVKKVLDGT